MNQIYSKLMLFITAFSLLISSVCYAVGDSSSSTGLQGGLSDSELENFWEVLSAPDDVLMHTEDKPESENFWEVLFTRDDNVNRPYKCDQCAYAATTNSDLKRHMHKHERNVEMPPAKVQKNSNTTKTLN